MEVAEKNISGKQLDYIQKAIAEGMSYQTYRDLVSDLAKNEQTTGEEQSESLINYTQLNDRRMNRWDKTLKIPVAIQEKIAKINTKITFLVLSESWCGDAAPSLPVMHKIAALNPNINLKIILRDENLELMDEFLTHGSRSVPKLIVFDEKAKEVIGEWGPRPSIATQMVKAYKKEHGNLDARFREDLQLWYNKDKGQNIVKDILGLLELKI